MRSEKKWRRGEASGFPEFARALPDTAPIFSDALENCIMIADCGCDDGDCGTCHPKKEDSYREALVKILDLYPEIDDLNDAQAIARRVLDVTT